MPDLTNPAARSAEIVCVGVLATLFVIGSPPRDLRARCRIDVWRGPSSNSPTEPPHRANHARRGPRGARRKAPVTGDASALGGAPRSRPPAHAFDFATRSTKGRSDPLCPHTCYIRVTVRAFLHAPRSRVSRPVCLAPRTPTFDIAPDGRRFLFVRDVSDRAPRAFSTCTSTRPRVLLPLGRCRWPRPIQWTCGRAC